MKVKEMIAIVEADGWYHVSTKGDHRQFCHPTKAGRVTIAGKLSADLAIGTQRNIFRQAQIPFRRSK